eukprot:maker-scaffold316_size209483-snap-gene-1.38 protein:Tk05941 transcript:maker-scaffold316_size209483-snap-gene-1.38-mRNA-1 annotation:"PREDICTED: uncharacterized protein LOC103505216"
MAFPQTSFICLSVILFSVVESGLPRSKSDIESPRYTIGSALTYLGKAVLTNALLAGRSFSILDDLQSASIQDSTDCAKRLICELKSKKELDWDEELIMQTIPPQLDYASPIIQFQLAADLGQKNPEQCSIVYSRCHFNGEDIMKLMRQRGTSLDIPTNPEYDCTVLFLWNKKWKGSNDSVDSDEAN